MDDTDDCVMFVCASFTWWAVVMSARVVRREVMDMMKTLALTSVMMMAGCYGDCVAVVEDNETDADVGSYVLVVERTFWKPLADLGGPFGRRRRRCLRWPEGNAPRNVFGTLLAPPKGPGGDRRGENPTR